MAIKQPNEPLKKNASWIMEQKTKESKDKYLITHCYLDCTMNKGSSYKYNKQVFSWDKSLTNTVDMSEPFKNSSPSHTKELKL